MILLLSMDQSCQPREQTVYYVWSLIIRNTSYVRRKYSVIYIWMQRVRSAIGESVSVPILPLLFLVSHPPADRV